MFKYIDFFFNFVSIHSQGNYINNIIHIFLRSSLLLYTAATPGRSIIGHIIHER